MRGVGVGFQLALDGIEPGFSDIRHLLERRQILRRGHFADRDPLFVGVVIAAELAGLETGTCERVRVQRTSDVLLRFILDRRVLVNQLHALGIDGLDEEVDRCGAPLRRQGDIGGDGGIKAERFFCLIQIPAVEGIAGLLGSSRHGRLAFVFHVPREGGLAIVRVEGHDPVVRDRADIICTRRDGVGRPDVVRNVVTDIIVRIFLGRRVQSPLNRVLRQQLVCARGVREVLVVACLCANVNKFVDFERRDVAAGSACFRFHRHNVLIEIDERYGDAVIADIHTAVLAEGMDAVGLAAGCDLGNLAPVGRRMGELDQIVNAGFYRRGCPRFVFPADVPAQRVLGVQVVRRILLERLHKVCDREGHDPCGIILALFKLIVLSDDARPCGILHLTAVHVLVAVLPEAVDAGNGDKAGQRIEDFVLRGFVDLRGGVALDFEGHFVAYRDCPFVSRPVIDQREHLLADFTLFKLMGAVRRIVRRTNRLLGILGNIRGRINCDIAGIARFFTAFYLTDRVGGSVVALQQRKANRLMLLICRAFDIHTTGIKFINVVRRRGLGRVKLRGGGAGSVDDGLVPHVACLLDLPSAVRVLKRKARGLVCNSRMRFAAVIHNCACGVHIRIVLQSIRLDRDRAGVVYDRADIIGACNHVRIQRSVFRILCRAVNLNIRLVVDILRLRGGSFRLLLLPDRVDGLLASYGDLAARLILSGTSRSVRPALEGIAFSGRLRVGDDELNAVVLRRLCLLLRSAFAAVGVVVQLEVLVIAVVSLGESVQKERKRMAGRTGLRRCRCCPCILGGTHIFAIDIGRRPLNNSTIHCQAQLPAAIVGAAASICIPLELIANLM